MTGKEALTSAAKGAIVVPVWDMVVKTWLHQAPESARSVFGYLVTDKMLDEKAAEAIFDLDSIAYFAAFGAAGFLLVDLIFKRSRPAA